MEVKYRARFRLNGLSCSINKRCNNQTRRREIVLNVLPSNILKLALGNGSVLFSCMRCAFSYLEQSALLFTDSWAADKHWITVSTNGVSKNVDLFHESGSTLCARIQHDIATFYFSWFPVAACVWDHHDLPSCVLCPVSSAGQHGLWERGADEGILQDDDGHDRALCHSGAFPLLLDGLPHRQRLLRWAAHAGSCFWQSSISLRLIFVLRANERMSHWCSCFSGGTVEDLWSCLMILSRIKTGKPPLPSHLVPVCLPVCLRRDAAACVALAMVVLHPGSLRADGQSLQ